MIVTIEPSNITGHIEVARSKSAMQRACAAALLIHGTTEIVNPGHSNDDRIALDIIQKLGAKVEVNNNNILIISNGIKPLSKELNCGESGLSMRMFTPIAALSDQSITITGEGSLLSRPMGVFDEIFPMMNVMIQSNDGKLPLVIKGPLQPKNMEIDGSLSSQFLTGLLMAYSAAGASDVSIRVNNLISKPYIDLTLKVMRDFEIDVPENKDYTAFYYPPIKKAIQKTNKKIHYQVEGDWSGAAFLLVAGAVAGNITLKGLDLFSTQADKAILEALQESGASISIFPEEIKMEPTDLKPFHFDATDCPDLFPPLVALAAYCNGKTIIEGVNRLTHKESNRGITLQKEFGKMGVEIILENNIMIVNGGKALIGANIDSHHDHRIAMACAVAALKANGSTTISNAEAINKSYPDFYDHLKYLGANIHKM